MSKKRDIYTNAAGKRLPGVTTVLNILSKPALIPWAVGETVKCVRENWKPDVPYKQEDIELVLRDAGLAADRKKRTAGDFGSNIHEIVESYIGGQLKLEDIKDPDEEKALKNFMIVTEGWSWLGAEIVVIHEELGYGGTADGIARLPDGRTMLADVKTSKSVYGEFDLQLAMYSCAEPTDAALRSDWKEIQEGRILHFNKERFTWEVLERDIKYHYPYVAPLMAMYEWRKTVSA